MTIENPERIVAARWHDAEDGHTYLAVGEVEDRRAMDEMRRPGDDAPVQAYVREDVAEAAVAAADAKYKNRDVEVMRVALADLRRIRGCLATRANTLRTIGEEDRAKGLEDAIKQLDEEVFA